MAWRSAFQPYQPQSAQPDDKHASQPPSCCCSRAIPPVCPRPRQLRPGRGGPVGNLFTPAGYEQGTKSPAIVVTHPFGAVKEQVRTTYAELLAAQGFITLVFEPPTKAKAAASRTPVSPGMPWAITSGSAAWSAPAANAPIAVRARNSTVSRAPPLPTAPSTGTVP